VLLTVPLYLILRIHLRTHIVYLIMVEWNDVNMSSEDNNKRTYNVRVSQ